MEGMTERINKKNYENDIYRRKFLANGDETFIKEKKI